MSAGPPFRADQVGSLLRPTALLEATERAARGEGSPEALRALQDRCIRDAIRFQESLGLQAITDGEFRRRSFASDFIEKLEGAGSPGHLAIATASSQFAPRAYQVTGKLRRAKPIELESFKFLKANTKGTAKQTIPSPTMLLRGGRGAVSREAYPDLEAFHADIAKVYREELRDLGAAGCGYVQLDDTNYAYLCDEKLRGAFREWGYAPEEMPERFAALINAVIAGRPKGMIAGIHVCRGNSAGNWAAQGGYEPVADALLNRLDVDAYFLEYDDARSGGFEPLRFYPRNSGKRVVLGLISTKNSELERKDDVKRRIEEASKYVPLDNLCLSPQCGFASTFRGNPITEDVQRKKLELVVQTAREVWGSAQ
jgi:5-methyltetrahydropteroyltriglutamate--homocysteine methyltransferase